MSHVSEQATHGKAAILQSGKSKSALKRKPQKLLKVWYIIQLLNCNNTQQKSNPKTRTGQSFQTPQQGLLPQFMNLDMSVQVHTITTFPPSHSIKCQDNEKSQKARKQTQKCAKRLRKHAKLALEARTTCQKP